MKRSHYFPWMGLIPLALGGCYVYSVAIPVVGTLLFIDRGEGVTQMRQVAVDESCRRQGVGPHRVLQAQGQGEGARQALRRHRLGDGVVGVGGAVEQSAHVVSADVLGHGGSTSFPTEINTIVSHTVALTSRKMRNTRKRGILY